MVCRWKDCRMRDYRLLYFSRGESKRLYFMRHGWIDCGLMSDVDMSPQQGEAQSRGRMRSPPQIDRE